MCKYKKKKAFEDLIFFSCSRSVLLSPLHHHHHPYSPSAERHQRRKQKQLAHLATKGGPAAVGMSPEKYRTINKV